MLTHNFEANSCIQLELLLKLKQGHNSEPLPFRPTCHLPGHAHALLLFFEILQGMITEFISDCDGLITLYVSNSTEQRVGF